MQPKLYILTRTDLRGVSSPGVQAGHAIAQYLIENPNTEWDNGTLIYLGISCEDELEYWKDKLNWKGLTYAEFREPDINNELTAIACCTNTKIFGKLRLLGEDNEQRNHNRQRVLCCM